MTDVIADITDVLAKAAGTQKAAKDAIDATQDDIKMAEDILNQVGADLFCSLKTSPSCLFRFRLILSLGNMILSLKLAAIELYVRLVTQ